ncbi:MULTISPECIES: cell division protein PerM [unclassified Rhodococcus (in: high G+C Gram-positive bacteria)]|uniref:cell division protein PerM n=1 Tax=Rhodococcus sp. SJ-3 TaxID=3454628 RepID=UPI002DB258BE|nr:DUF6350 family protein [Rhodococcus sp. (in: high G+C Gram-positive bacteria)]
MTSTLGRPVRHTPSDDEHIDSERFRILIAAAARVPAVTIAFVATVVVITMVVANSDLTGIYAAIAGTWLALHQVTLSIDDTSLGVLPLLPTGLIVWQAARASASAVDSTIDHTEQNLTLQDAARIVVATLAGPMIVTVIALVVMQDAAGVLPVTTPNAAAALSWVNGLYLLAAVLGIGSRTWRVVCRRYEVPEWLVLSVRPAVRALLSMFAIGGVLTLVGMALSWTTMGDLLERGEGVVGVLGLTVLSVLYLPNVFLGASSILAGSTVQFGDVRLSLFEASGGDLPALPVLAAIPAGPAAAFWPVMLAVPATVGALAGRFVAHRVLQAQADGLPVRSSDASLTLLAAAAQTGVAIALLTWAAGGPLGIFGIVGSNWWLTGVLVFAWVGLLGLITAQLLMWREGKFAAAQVAEDEYDDYEDEYDDLDGDDGDDQVKAIEGPGADTADDGEEAADPEDVEEPATEDDDTEDAGTEDAGTEDEVLEARDTDGEAEDSDDPNVTDPNVIDAEVVDLEDEESDAHEEVEEKRGKEGD